MLLKGDSMKRVAIYSRVSTSNLGQSTDAQVIQATEYANSRGFKIVEVIMDEGYSGKSNNRPGLIKLLQLTSKRKVDVVIVSKLDRLFRSLQHIVSTLNDFNETGIEFISINDHIDMSTSAGRLMTHMIASFAEFERELISERTKLGMEHARRKGKVIGRPSNPFKDEILQLRSKGMSYREIQKTLGCSQGVIWRTIKAAP